MNQFPSADGLQGLLWSVLITMADDDGRFRATPAIVHGHGYPYDDEALALLPGWLDELAAVGLLVLYGDLVAGRQPFGAHPRWHDHQRINKPTASKLPAPPGPPATSPEFPGESSGTSGPEVEVEKEKEREVERGAANAAAPRAGAHEPADAAPHRSSSGDPTAPTPMAWPQVRGALLHAGFDEQALEADRSDIADLLAAEDRPIDWAAVGRQLKTDRRPRGRKPPRCHAKTPKPAIAYALNQNWPPLLAGGEPAPIGLAPDPELAQAWPAVLDDARREIGDGSWDSWLAVIRPIRSAGTAVDVVVPPHAQTWIRDRLAPLLGASCSRILQREVTVAVHAGQAVAA